MKNKKLWVFVGIVVLIVLINQLFGISDWLGGDKGLSFLKKLVEENLMLAILIYIIVTIISCVVFALPGVTFAIAASVLFGPILGTICCVIATTLGAMLAFLTGRYFLKDSIKPTVQKNKYLKKWLFDESWQNEFFVLMITRLVPIFPYNLQNFAYGITDISFASYSIGTLIFILPGTAMYTVGFSGFTETSGNRWVYLAISIVLAVVVIGISMWLKKKYVVKETVGSDRGSGKAPYIGADKDSSLDLTRCIHCHKCQNSCKFLAKHRIDIGDGDKLNDLAYHCFLCGECTAVCPMKIDGREVVLRFRQSAVDDLAGEEQISKRYKGMLLEKRKYIFKNYRHAGNGHAAFFPGCNFVSMYPKTTKHVVALLKEANIGVIYDCCGKPVAELGLAEDEQRIISDIDNRLRELGISELVTACPNCYDFLGGKLEAKVVSIYDKLAELGIGAEVEGGKKMFMPCPDRNKGVLLSQIEENFAKKPFEKIDGVQCCGLGGSAGACEPELAKNMTNKLEDGIWVYCATCAGKITRDGHKDVKHVLPEILGTCESPDTKKSYFNRVFTKFK